MCTYVTNRGKSKLMVKVRATDFCFLLSPGLLSLETTARCSLWRRGRSSYIQQAIYVVDELVTSNTQNMRLLSERKEKRENEKVEGYSLGNLLRAPSIQYRPV